MSHDAAVESAIQHYIDTVATSLAGAPAKRRNALSRELREHIQEAIHVRTSGKPPTLQDVYAVLAEMDPPEAYADALTCADGERKPNARLVALALVCCAVQIAGLGATVAGIPVVGAIGGFAAVVSFFLVWSSRRSPKWLIRLTGVAAICGLGMIIVGIAGG